MFSWETFKDFSNKQFTSSHQDPGWFHFRSCDIFPSYTITEVLRDSHLGGSPPIQQWRQACQSCAVL